MKRDFEKPKSDYFMVVKGIHKCFANLLRFNPVPSASW